MRFTLVIDEPSQTLWEASTALPRILIGLGCGWLAVSVPLAFSPSPWRWWLIGGLAWVCIGVMIYLLLNMPTYERGHAVRNSEGGLIEWERRWLVGKAPTAWSSSLEAVTSFWLEIRDFEETAGWTYSMARLWAFLGPEQALLLTAWGEPDEIKPIATCLAHVARCPLQEN